MALVHLNTGGKCDLVKSMRTCVDAPESVLIGVSI